MTEPAPPSFIQKIFGFLNKIEDEYEDPSEYEPSDTSLSDYIRENLGGTIESLKFKYGLLEGSTDEEIKDAIIKEEINKVPITPELLEPTKEVIQEISETIEQSEEIKKLRRRNRWLRKQIREERSERTQKKLQEEVQMVEKKIQKEAIWWTFTKMGAKWGLILTGYLASTGINLGAQGTLMLGGAAINSGTQLAIAGAPYAIAAIPHVIKGAQIAIASAPIIAAASVDVGYQLAETYFASGLLFAWRLRNLRRRIIGF